MDETALDTPLLADEKAAKTTTGTGAPENAELPLTVLEPRPGWKAVDFGELWRYRELLFFLTWRDVKVRYKQTLLGAAWAIIQPFMMMVVFTIFLGRMAGVDSGDFPYPVFVYAGLLPWTFFATAIASAANSVVGSQRLVTKVYFPRLAIPFASVGAAVVDFLIAFGMLVVLMLYYGIQPRWPMLLVPGLLALAMLAALGVGTLLAALNVAYRDFKYMIPFMVQIWMFATPTVYMQYSDSYAADPPAGTATREAHAADHGTADDKKPASEGAVPDSIQRLLALNPMTGLIAFFRASTLGGPLPWRELGFSALVIVTVFFVGCLYFRRVESSFADII